MSASTPRNEPRLAKPGAGLPFYEWFAAKYFIFPRRFATTSCEKAVEEFLDESAKIKGLAGGLSQEQLAERRLVPRLRGLEDSSRYWSVAMAIEHLVIVGERMSNVVANLSQSKSDMPTVTIAEVKPADTVDAFYVVGAFDQMTLDFVATARACDVDRFPEAKYPHPWFGPLNARQWLLFAAPHQAIHRRQIQEIISRL